MTLPQPDISVTASEEEPSTSHASVAGFQFDIPSPEIDDIILSDNEGHTQSFVPNFSADSDSKLYHNASVTTLQAVCMLLSWFTSFPGISKSSFSRLLNILHNFLLPKDNTLPTKYADALRLLQPFLSPAKEYHSCVNDCVIFRNSTAGKYEKLTKCPECGENRFEPGSTIPRKRFKYLPLGKRIQRLFGSAKTSQLLQSHNTSNSDQTVTDSIHSSEAWKTWYCSSGLFKGDSRALSFAVCMDGLNPFAIEKNSYSMWPMFLIPLNLPHHIRMTSTSMMLMGLIPGPTELKNTDPYVDVLVDDILDVNEMTMYDAYKDEMFRLKAIVVLHIFDYPGQNKILNCQGMHTNCECVTVSTRNYTPFEQTLFFLYNLDFLALIYFPSCKHPWVSIFWNIEIKYSNKCSLPIFVLK